MDLEPIKRLMAEDISAFNALIQSELHAETPLIEEIGHHIVKSGGKRLRPLITLITARASGYQGTDHIKVATVVEFLHTSTLLHDDVVDNSSLRRGQPTANAHWGNAASVLVGDFLFSRAFQLIVSVKSLELLQILADATNVIAEGEVLQLTKCRDPDTTEADYLKIIEYKTAKLFETAARSGAILNRQLNHDQTSEQAFTTYGKHLGMAFQLIDDVLDYIGDSEILGKKIGDDLAEGKPTLPLIYLLQHGNADQKQLVRKALQKHEEEDLPKILEAVQQSGALEYTIKHASRETDLAVNAISGLEQNEYIETLIQLAQDSLKRCY